MAASTGNKFTDTFNSANPNSARVTSGRTAGTFTLACDNLAGWPTVSKVHFATYKIDTNSAKVAGTQIDWYGIVSGNSIGSMSRLAGATDAGNAIGDVVEMMPTGSWAHDLYSGLTAEHNQDGTHAAVTATSINNAGALTQTGAATLTGALTIQSYDGWISSADTWVYASASTFTIAGVDRTAQFPVGTKLKLTQTTAKYFYVTSATFSTNTTVTVAVTTDYTLANAAITSPNLSYDASPQGFPTSFSWAGTVVGWTSTTVATKTFSMTGKRVYWIVDYSGTSNSTSLTITAPVTQSSSIATVEGKCGLTVDNAAVTNTGAWSLASSTITFFVDNGRSNLWTNTGTKQVRAQGFYDAA